MKAVKFASRIGGYVAMAVVVIMMLLIVSDVFMRYVFDNPISGTSELTELMMVWLMLGIAWGAFEGTHVKIDLIMSRFSPKVQHIVEIFTLVLSLGIYVLTVWQGVEAMRFSLEYGVKTTILKMPESLSIGFFTFGFAFFCLAVTALLVQRVVEVIKR